MTCALDRGEFDLIDEIAGFGTFQYQQLYRALIDDGGALAMETAVVGLTVTYAGATAAFLTPETLAGTSAWVVGLLPAPLWLVAVFLSVFSAAQGRRTLGGLFIERQLLEIAGLEPAARKVVGLSGLQSVMDFREVGKAAKFGLLISFGGEALLAVGLQGSRSRTVCWCGRSRQAFIWSWAFSRLCSGCQTSGAQPAGPSIR